MIKPETYRTHFWIENVTSSSGTVTIKKSNDAAPTITFQYTTNPLGNWTSLQPTSTTQQSITVPANTRIYLRANSNSTAFIENNTTYSTRISSTMNCSIGGNIMSLLYGSNFTGTEVLFPDESIDGIFASLFYNWTYLTDASELVLPVTHVVSTTGIMGRRCYVWMFGECSNLKEGPMIDLRAKDATDLPYALQRMFSGCLKIRSVHCCLQDGNNRYNNTVANNAGQTSGCRFFNYSGTIPTLTSNFVIKNVISAYLDYKRVIDWKDGYGNTFNQVDDSKGDTIYLKNYSDSEMSTPFYVQNINKQDETLTITQLEDSSAQRRRIKYSYDNVTWYDLGITNYGSPLSVILHPSEKIYLKMNDYQDASAPCQNIRCKIDGVSKVGGNIMSLAYGTLFTGKETSTPYTINGSYWSTSFYFANLFEGNTNIVDASELILPALSLYGNDYSAMFKNCTSLRYAPLSLPALSAIRYPGSSLVPQACYLEMFYGCTSLVTTPVIQCNETFMPDMCNAMFQGCTSLTKAANLYATTLTDSCYGNMFRGCTSLTKAPDLYATTLADGCYGNMFQGCTSLTKAPDLNATTLTTQCYSGMFIGCSNLSYIKCLATDISAADCTSYWTNGVAANGTFVKDANTAWTTGVSGIPSGWTVQNN